MCGSVVHLGMLAVAQILITTAYRAELNDIIRVCLGLLHATEQVVSIPNHS